jgi:branched-chain amino acid transport system substrate-binding protein
MVIDPRLKMWSRERLSLVPKVKISAISTTVTFLLMALLQGCSSESKLDRGRMPTSEEAEPIAAPPVSAERSHERDGITDSEVVIGSCSALDGPAAALGKQTVLGAKVYLDYINDAGGVNGRKIKLLTYDDGYEPHKAIDCFNQLMKQNIFAAAFFVGTPTAAKYVPMAEANKIPLLGLFTGAQLLHEPFKPHVISVRASYYDETREQVDHLWNDLGIKKIGVIYQDDAFGATVLAGVRKALEHHGATAAVLGSFPRNTLDVNDAVNRVREGNPEAVILAGTYKPVAEIIKQSHKSGWHPLFLTVSFVGTEAFIKAAGKDAEGTVITQVVPPYNRDDLATVSLYKKLLTKYAPKEQPTFVSLEGFIDALVVVEGLKLAGQDLTRTKFIAAIESIHDKDVGLGPNLKLNYGPTRHKGFDSVYYTVVKGGQPITFVDWKQFRSR